MQKKRLTNQWLMFIVVFYAIGFAISVFYDLPITYAFYKPKSLFPIFMEALGWYPVFLPPILGLMLYASQPKNSNAALYLRVVFWVLAVAGQSGIYYVSYKYLIKRGLIVGKEDPATWLWVATAFMASCALILFVLRLKNVTRQKMLFFSAFGSVYCFFGQAATQMLKIVWGRPRFDDMLALGSFSQFRLWFLPFGPGGSSFPSGHTANAAGVFLLLVLCDLFPNFAQHKKLISFFCATYILAMAATRIIIGRHFLSDTLFASLLMLVGFYALKNTNFYKERLKAILDNNI